MALLSNRSAALRQLPLLLFIASLILLPFIISSSAAGLTFASAREETLEDLGDDVVSRPGDGEEVGLVGEGVQDTPDVVLAPAAGVDSVFFFSKYKDKLIPAGQQSEILVGISNKGESPLKVTTIRGSLHLQYDHRISIQNFTTQELNNSIVPPGVQASFSYPFTVYEYLLPGQLAFVASIFYEVDDELHRTVFYNGTIEVVESSGFISGETVFLITLGLGLLGLFSMWIYGQFQRLSKKTRRAKTVETGTRSTDGVSNEWLQGTAFTQKLSKSVSQSTKSKKKK
ncbi:hypothetical protein O6H91_18G081000 [Diphasiastrum complanatum]|uniref:Uncharacterized protein n=1 Tax=Diphasiastrum complanatum TaxID=34168 RepID=A0ACC2B338_DIPCM|nr:hypothetical protein O6H91_18G081000 [Diphasiastrum complanatum]